MQEYRSVTINPNLCSSANAQDLRRTPNRNLIDPLGIDNAILCQSNASSISQPESVLFSAPQSDVSSERASSSCTGFSSFEDGARQPRLNHVETFQDIAYAYHDFGINTRIALSDFDSFEAPTTLLRAQSSNGVSHNPPCETVKRQSCSMDHEPNNLTQQLQTYSPLGTAEQTLPVLIAGRSPTLAAPYLITPERPHQCSSCGIRFAIKIQLSRHRCERLCPPLECSIPHCDRTFKHQKDMKRHLEAVHGYGISLHTCPYCGIQKNRKDNLSRHVKICKKSRNRGENELEHTFELRGDSITRRC